METRFNQETGKTTWEIKAWYEKVFFVVGVLWSALFCLGFLLGILSGI